MGNWPVATRWILIDSDKPEGKTARQEVTRANSAFRQNHCDLEMTVISLNSAEYSLRCIAVLKIRIVLLMDLRDRCCVAALRTDI